MLLEAARRQERLPQGRGIVVFLYGSAGRYRERTGNTPVPYCSFFIRERGTGREGSIGTFPRSRLKTRATFENHPLSLSCGSDGWPRRQFFI